MLRSVDLDTNDLVHNDIYFPRDNSSLESEKEDLGDKAACLVGTDAVQPLLALFKHETRSMCS